MTLRPLHDYVLVQPLPYKETTAGGLAIPESARRPEGALVHGKVLAVGPGDKTKHGKRLNLDIRPGDNILYWPCPPNDHESEGRKQTLVHAETHVAVVLG